MKQPRCKVCNTKLKDGCCPDCGWRERYTDAATECTQAAPPKKKKNTEAIVWGAVCALLLVLPGLLNTTPILAVVFAVQEAQVSTEIPASTYSDVLRELSPTGATVEVTLEVGNHIVGIDIPEGCYEARVDDSAMANVEDEDNDIRLYLNLDTKSDSRSPYLQNVQLYEGAILRIEHGKILFTSTNAQSDELQLLPKNEDLATHYPQDGAVAGIDFPEGTYDITLVGEGRGMVKVSFSNRYEDSLGFLGVLGTDLGAIPCYRNVEFPKGTLLEISNVEIALVPSVRNSLLR